MRPGLCLPARSGLVLALALLTTATSGCPGSDGRPSLILITIDTARADHLSVYGYPRPTSPTLEALAARGVTFDAVMAPLPETAPSCAALLTGQWPARLQMRGNGEPLAASWETLAEILSAEGYETAAFISGFPLLARLSGLQQGFSLYDDRLPDPRGRTPEVQRGAEKTTAAALEWLAASSGPRFAWVHYYDPHGDYAPGAPWDSMFDDGISGPHLPLESIPAYQRLGGITDAAVYVARYDGEIRRVDEQIAGLLRHLEDRGELANTLVAVTADHGESLTEHGYYLDHGNEVYLPSVRVPLILAGPRVPVSGDHIDGIARTVDILPTLLDLLELSLPTGLAGVSLAPRLAAASQTPLPEAFTEARFKPYKALAAGVDTSPKLAARDDRFTVILRTGSSRLEVYDRLTDPGETRDLLPRWPAGPAGDLRAVLERKLRRRLLAITEGELPPPDVFSRDVRLQLEKLVSGAARP